MAYEKELSVALKLAREAGELTMRFFKKGVEVRTKEDGTAVTKADIESNKLIINGIRKEFPNDAIVSEESVKTRGKREWHIDPLDGTMAFVKGEDSFTIHIGLCENGSPVLGVVFMPTTNEMYYGIKGGQACKISDTGRKSILHVNEPNLNEMVAVSTFSEKTDEKVKSFMEELGIKKLIKKGGTGKKIIMLAENEADVFPVMAIAACTWDFCAPQAVLEAAGGIIEYVDGQAISYKDIIKFPNKVLAGKSRKQIDFIREKTLHLFS